MPASTATYICLPFIIPQSFSIQAIYPNYIMLVHRLYAGGGSLGVRSSGSANLTCGLGTLPVLYPPAAPLICASVYLPSDLPLDLLSSLRPEAGADAVAYGESCG